MVDKKALLSASALACATFGTGSAMGQGAPVSDGKTIYQNHCAACHDGGVERAPTRATLGKMQPSAILNALTNGAMKLQGSSLDENEKQTLAHFLGTTVAQVSTGDGYGPSCTGPAAHFSSQAAPWPGWGIDLRNSHAIAAQVSGVSRADLGKLKVSWARAYPNALRARSQPGFLGGAAFVGSHDGTVYALDQASGCVRWHYKAPAEVRTGIVIGSRVEHGHALPTLYFGDLAGFIHALDARTGRMIWQEKPETNPQALITAAPTFYNGRLYASVSSLEVLAADDPDYGCCTFRGSVVAFDAANGKKIWQTYAIPRPPSPQEPNARGVMQLGPSGAPIWNTPTIDTRHNRLYVGTGENYSSPADGNSDAVMALDLTSGAVLWRFQLTKGDAWNGACARSKVNCPRENGPDGDIGAATILARTREGRNLLLAGAKSGTLVALAPASGKLIWRTRIGRGGMGGGIRFGMALSGETLFVPTGDTAGDRSYPGPPEPGLFAVNIRNGKLLWSAPSEDACAGKTGCRAGYPGAITVTDNMVLAGGRDGVFRIHDTATGKVIYRFDTARDFSAINGPAKGGAMSGGTAPVAFDGRIYLNSGYGFGADVPGNLLLVLGKGGR